MVVGYDIMNTGCDKVVLFKDKKSENRNNVLSATRPKEPIVRTSLETSFQLQTRLKQKSIIKIYVDENKYYVEHSAAYALGLIKTRAVMIDTPKLIAISSEVHNKLKSNNSIDIEYIRMEKKQTLKVYVNDSQYCIDNSAAYALGFLSIEQFNNSENSDFYYINEDTLNNLKGKYNIEFYSLNLKLHSSDKVLKNKRKT